MLVNGSKKELEVCIIQLAVLNSKGGGHQVGCLRGHFWAPGKWWPSVASRCLQECRNNYVVSLGRKYLNKSPNSYVLSTSGKSIRHSEGIRFSGHKSVSYLPWGDAVAESSMGHSGGQQVRSVPQQTPVWRGDEDQESAGQHTTKKRP